MDVFKIYLRTAYLWFYVHILNTFLLVTIFVNKGISQMPPDRKEICILAKYKDFYKIISNEKYNGQETIRISIICLKTGH